MRTLPRFRPRFRPGFLLLAVLLGGLAGGPSASADEGGFAVLELFTSQGCSSCPPADRILEELAARGDREQQEIFALSFHVDYWNQLGWKDPFSAAAYTQRQRLYAGVLGDNRIYTPQLIVNGRTGFVGSHRRKADAAVEAALSGSPPRSLKLQVSIEDDSVTATTELQPEDGLLLNVALVQKSGTVKVPRGENANRTLTHRNIVRSFEVLRASDKRLTTQLTVPKDMQTTGATVVAYLQVSRTGEIVAARRVPLAKSEMTARQ